MQTAIPCVLMRGGTSRGLYFLARDLPDAPYRRDRILMAAMGSPDSRQIDGAGGGTSTSSKVAIVSPSADDDADVDYLFAQVGVDTPTVDTAPSCGNILAGVGPYAIEQGLVAAAPGRTTVRIRNVNTGTIIDATVETPDGEVTFDGDQEIDGVPGSGAPIRLSFRSPMGAKTGRLLPTGTAADRIGGVEVTCIDAAMPMVVIEASSLGLKGDEAPAALDADAALLERIEAIRREAGRRMGLGDVAGSVIPKVAIVSPPRRGGGLCARYFVPDRCHAAIAATGAITLAACAVVDGSVVSRVARGVRETSGRVTIEHPAGAMAVDLECGGSGRSPVISRASIVRTARPIFVGAVQVPRHLIADDTAQAA